VSLNRFLRLPPDTPAVLQWSIAFYLVHIVLEGKIALSELSIAAALGCAIWAIWKRQLAVSFHILYVPLLVYGVASTISALIAEREIHSFGETALWIKLLVFPYAVSILREVPGARRLVLNAFYACGIFSALYGLFQYLALNQRDLEHRITGASTHVMTYSGLLLPLALLFLVAAFHRRRWWLYSGALLTSLTLVLTFTRSVWIGWAGAVAVLLLLSRPRSILYVAPLALWLVILSPLPLFGRMASTFDTTQSSNFDRIRMLQGGVEIIRDYPLFGVGPANIKEIYPLYRRPDAPRFRIPHLHNNIVQIWAERGILALWGYLLLLVLFMREVARGWATPRRMYAQIGLAVVVSLTCAGMFEFNFGDTEVLLALLDLFALVVVSCEEGSEAGRPDAPRLNGNPAAAVA
jgi:O-antigen ligase